MKLLNSVNFITLYAGCANKTYREKASVGVNRQQKTMHSLFLNHDNEVLLRKTPSITCNQIN